MSVKVSVPTPLRRFTENNGVIEVAGSSVSTALDSLVEKYPVLKKQLYSDDGRLRSFVNVYVNDEDIRYLQQSETPVKAGDTISIVPSIAGGVEESDER
jgi:molybdopterin synthase sulfur carrier subunit